ncbi:MAG TPA: lysylphosphatidylglycerol synthase transmembrane domain-containing protein [Lacipirellulaceae bacterium]|nr:lysylphosphatidylglycerol synthase transmembrane domain-containing protein [Lacipirellulaceae bacterium]
MTAPHSATRRTLVAAAKIALAAAILAYLVWQAREHDAFTRLVEEPKHWPALVAGAACTFAAALLGFVRWHLLIRAVGISVRLADTLRLGALGFALNFVSLGAIGGDLFRAIFLAHGQPGRRTEAVATVAADRLLGVTTMLALAGGGILSTDLIHASSPGLALLSKTILATAALVFTGAALLLFVPAFSGAVISGFAGRVPIAGTTLARLLAAVRAYREQKGLLTTAAAVSALSNVMFITSFYFVAGGLPVHRPTWTEHLVAIPVASMVGAIPISFAGLGTMELAIEELYQHMPGAAGVQPGDGTMASLAQRVTMIAVALVGVLYYLRHRVQVREVYAEAEEIAEARR